MRRGTLLALMFASNEQLIAEVKVEGLSCSDHEIVEFRILRGERKVKSKLTTVDLRTADFGHFKDLLGRVIWDKALEARGALKLVDIQGSPPPSSRAVHPDK